MNELNYPIKYAVLEVKERGGYAVNYEIVTLGFIVSKCYVIESSIRYLRSGKEEPYHKVVFPFKNITKFEEGLHSNQKYLGEANIPNDNFYNNASLFNIVDIVFEDYDDAKKFSEEKNEFVRIRHEFQRPFLFPNDKLSDYNKQLKIFEQEKKEIEKRIILCHKFEEAILEQTEEMIISENDSVKKLVR